MLSTRLAAPFGVASGRVIRRLLPLPFAATLPNSFGWTRDRLPGTWLYHSLKAAGLPIICLEARHARAATTLQRNKTDANDAETLARAHGLVQGGTREELCGSCCDPSGWRT